MIRRVIAHVALFASGHAAAAESQTLVSFIACPVYRDTDAGRKSGCWLADERVSGARFDITPSPTKPDWNHAVLVEGRVAAEQDDACGGVVLDPARVSVLKETCPRHMIPAEGYPGRKFVLPERNVAPLGFARELPAEPYQDRTFNLFFDWNSSFVVYQLSDYLLDQAVSWLRAARPPRITVTGFAATDPVETSGMRMAEPAVIAKERAQVVAEALTRLGFDPATVTVRWRTSSDVSEVLEADRLPEASRRRVEIAAEF